MQAMIQTLCWTAVKKGSLECKKEEGAACGFDWAGPPMYTKLEFSGDLESVTWRVIIEVPMVYRSFILNKKSVGDLEYSI